VVVVRRRVPQSGQNRSLIGRHLRRAAGRPERGTRSASQRWRRCRCYAFDRSNLKPSGGLRRHPDGAASVRRPTGVMAGSISQRQQRPNAQAWKLVRCPFGARSTDDMARSFDRRGLDPRRGRRGRRAAEDSRGRPSTCARWAAPVAFSPTRTDDQRQRRVASVRHIGVTPLASQ
jgi:hypothetical protein